MAARRLSEHRSARSWRVPDATAGRWGEVVSWTVLGALLLLYLLAEFNLLPPDLVGHLSPFAATFTGLFVGDLPITLVVLAAIGAGLAALGVLGLQRRDLQPS